MSVRNVLLATAATIATVAIGSPAHAVVFSLGASVGSSPTFGITSGGITATFTSPAGNGFVVQNTAGLFTFSPALYDNNSFSTDSLTISFSQPISGAITIPFAIQDAYGINGPDTLSVTTNVGQSLTFGATPDGLALGEPEGVVSFAPAAGTTSLTLSSPIAFAIGNVTVPEPVSMGILGAGLLGFAASRRRRA